MVAQMLWHNRENTLAALSLIRERMTEIEKALRSDNPSDMIAVLTRDN
jgi:prephenate dehydrogenase